MNNLINQIERITTTMQRGWPEGTHELHREIPVLLARISELESALVPFARIWNLEKSVGTPKPEALANVYLKHCQAAFEVITTENSDPIRVDDFFSLPAEG
jgi:hypothetical protein